MVQTTMTTHRVLLLVILHLPKGWCRAYPVETFSYDSVLFKCKYDPPFKNLTIKYLCKTMDNGDRNVIVKTKSSDGWNSKGRFTLYDNKERGFIKVLLRESKPDDTGTYWCGMDQNCHPHNSTEILLRVYQGASGKKEINKFTGHVGHSITVKCKYGDNVKGKSKYLCKYENNGCKRKIRTGQKQRESGKFSLYDNTTGRYFQVSITNLNIEDRGKYWCAEDEPFDNGSEVAVDKFNVFELDVHTGAPQTVPVTSYIGGTAVMRCPFTHGLKHNYTNNNKYVCKMEGSRGPSCADVIRTNANDQLVTQGRFSLLFNMSTSCSIFKVTQVTKEDAGMYRCGIDVPVSDDAPVTVDELIQARLYIEHGVNISPQVPSTSPRPFGSTLPSVVLTVCLFGMTAAVFGLRVFVKSRKRSKQVPAISLTSTLQGNDRECADDSDGVYEEIQDTCLSPLEINTVYVKAQLPTIPCADSNYSTAELPTIPCADSTYSTAQPPTRPCSDSTYSMAQPPTRPCSDSTFSMAQPPTRPWVRSNM